MIQEEELKEKWSAIMTILWVSLCPLIDLSASLDSVEAFLSSSPGMPRLVRRKHVPYSLREHVESSALLSLLTAPNSLLSICLMTTLSTFSTLPLETRLASRRVIQTRFTISPSLVLPDLTKSVPLVLDTSSSGISVLTELREEELELVISPPCLTVFVLPITKVTSIPVVLTVMYSFGQTTCLSRTSQLTREDLSHPSVL